MNSVNNCIIVDFQRRAVVKTMPVLLPRPVRGMNYIGSYDRNKEMAYPKVAAIAVGSDSF